MPADTRFFEDFFAAEDAVFLFDAFEFGFEGTVDEKLPAMGALL